MAIGSRARPGRHAARLVLGGPDVRAGNHGGLTVALSGGKIARPAAVGLAALALVAGTISSSGAYVRSGRTMQVDLAHDGGQPTCPVNAQRYSDCHPTAFGDVGKGGRYVAFWSFAPNLVAGDINQVSDVFVRDTTRNKTALVSRTSDGSLAIGNPVEPKVSFAPSLTPNGRFVVFLSEASNLVPGDTNLSRDVFVHDRKTSRTGRVSVGPTGAQLQGTSDKGSISANGRYVSFWNNGVYVHDRKTNKSTLVSVASDGTPANRAASAQTISADGRHVLFDSFADNLVEGDSNGCQDVFVHNRVTGKTTLVSVASDGRQGSAPPGSSLGLSCRAAQALDISADGRFVLFQSVFDNLVPNDTNFEPQVLNLGLDVFLHDRKTGRTERISVATTGAQGREDPTPCDFNIQRTAQNGDGTISADGRYVTFVSNGTDLVADDENDRFENRCPTSHPYGYDRRTGAVELLARSSDGTPAQSLTLDPMISPDSRYVGFISSAQDLTPGKETLHFNVYLRDRGRTTGVGGVVTPGTQQAVAVARSAAFSRTGVIRFADANDDVAGGVSVGAELIGATVAYRQLLSDLYVRVDVDRIPGPRGTGTAGNPGLVYGMELTADGTRYHLRAQGTGLTARFGLFRCAPTCTEVAQLQGGYGTTGESIVMSVPLDALRLGDGGVISNLLAYSALGAYEPGPTQVLDRAGMK